MSRAKEKKGPNPILTSDELDSEIRRLLSGGGSTPKDDEEEGSE